MDWDAIRRDTGWDVESEEPQASRTPALPANLETWIPQVHHSPVDIASTTLSILGLEVLGMIMDIIHLESPASLSSVALVNSTYYHLARHSQFRDVSFDIGTTRKTQDETDHLRSFSTYLENAGLFSSVRELRISCKSEKASEGEISQITSLIPKLMGLTDLVWHCHQPIPDTILQHLQKRPSLRLHIEALNVAPPYDLLVEPDDTGNRSLSKLQSCINLRSLGILQTFSDHDHALAVTKPLRLILLSCPNLRRLKLDINMPTSGCVVSRPPREYCGLGFLEGECPLAALEELNLVHYPFGLPQPVEVPGSPPTVLSRWPSNCNGYPLQVHEEDYWACNFDWSHIKRLVAPSGLGMKLMPYLTSLREVSMHHGSSQELQQFYNQVPAALQAITVSKLGDVGLKPILRHAASLRKLQIHQTQGRGWAKQAVGLHDLEAIRNNCPYIEELGIDLARSGTWPYNALDILASFPKLHRLELWFELGAEDCENPIRPYTTFHATREIVRYLHSKSVRSPPCLKIIQINSGCPVPLGFGYPAPKAFWPKSNSTSFICSLSDRDDEAINGVITTECTKIGRPGNLFLDSTQPGLSNEEFEKALATFRSGVEASCKKSPLYSFDTSINHRAIRLAYNGPAPWSMRWRWMTLVARSRDRQRHRTMGQQDSFGRPIFDKS